MKAIIITFHGEAPEKNYDEIIRKMAELVFNNTSAKIEDISAATLNDKEVSEALLQKVVIAPVSEFSICFTILGSIKTPSFAIEDTAVIS